MALTPSHDIPLGTPAPTFSLPDVVAGVSRSLDSLKGSKGTVVMFICNHCPFVKHIEPYLPQFTTPFIERGVSFVGISSNDSATYPQDGPDKMRELARTRGYPFPYLFDDSQDIARSYSAQCTPEFFLFDRDLKLVYHGEFDPSRPGNGIEVTGSSLKGAIDALLAGEPPLAEQRPSIGCNIKWR